VGHEQLPVEVAGFQVAAVGEDQAANASRGELERNRAAKSADARNQHGRALEPTLAVFAKTGDGELPVVGGEFLGGQLGESRGTVILPVSRASSPKIR
jgi:hypothetical protein